MFKRLPRIQSINSTTLLGAGGEYSDTQYIIKMLAQLTKADFTFADGNRLSPREVHSYLARLLYNRRSKVDPLWNSLIVGGIEADGSIFLGEVDLYGSNYTGDLLATGYGQHLAIPLLRKHHHIDLTYDEAKTLLEDCQRVLIYRDCRTLNSFQLATITKDGPSITQPYSISTEWGFKRFVNPADTE